VSALDDAHQEALERGDLVFQRCGACGNAWLPPRDACPRCLAGDAWAWEVASGRASLVSWVVYHRAYHPSVEDRVPYTVALVELEEGPRLVADLPSQDVEGAPPLRAGLPLALVVTRPDGRALASFEIAQGG